MVMANKKTFSTEMSGAILDEFNSYVVQHGYVKYRAVEAAMKAFMAFPPDVQSALMQESKNQKGILNLIANGIIDKQILSQITHLLPEQKGHLFQEIKQLRAKVSRKK